MTLYRLFPAAILTMATIAACNSVPETESGLDDARTDYRAPPSDPPVIMTAPAEMRQVSATSNTTNDTFSSNDDQARKVGTIATQGAGQTADASPRQLVRSQSLSDASPQGSAAELQPDLVATQLRELNAKRTERGLVITLSDVQFDTDQAQLKPGGTPGLQRLADFLKQNPQRKARVEGYTDSTGDPNYNQWLSGRRAAAVRTSLADMGVNADRITTQGYGGESPVSSNDTTAGRQLNRRVEVIISDDNGDISMD